MFNLISAERRPKSAFQWQKGMLLLVLALFMVTATGCFGLFPKAPHEVMIAAAKKTNNLKELGYLAEMSFRIKSEDPALATFNQIFNEISIPFSINVDKKEKRGQLGFALLYKGVDCGNLLLYADRECISAQSNFLGEKVFFFAWNDLQPLIKKYLNLQVQITDYFPLLFETKRKTSRQAETAIYDLYTDFYADHLSAGQKKVDVTINDGQQEETIVCKEIILQMGHEDLNFEESKRYLLALLENEAILALLQEKITQLVTIAKNNGDLATWSVTEEDLLSFRDNLDDFLAELATKVFTQQQAMEALHAQPQTSLQGKFRIDRQGLFRNMVLTEVMAFTNFSTEEPLLVELVIEANLVKPGQDLAFIDFNGTEVIDLGQLSAAGWQSLGEEVVMNLIAQLMGNPLIQDLMQMSALLYSAAP